MRQKVFVLSQTLFLPVSLIRIPSTGKRANCRNQPLTVFVWNQKKKTSKAQDQPAPEPLCVFIQQLGSGQTPGELLTPLVLNSILTKALQYSLHGDTHLAGNFTFALRYLPETFHPHAPDSLNCLELRYKVSRWNLRGFTGP